MIRYYFVARLYGQVSDPAMLKRLQTEYDAFFVRATRCIFSSQRLGAWQFLAVVPYNTVSLSTLWRIFYSLHEEYQEEDSLVAGADTKTGDCVSGIFAFFRTVGCQLSVMLQDLRFPNECLKTEVLSDMTQCHWVGSCGCSEGS